MQKGRVLRPPGFAVFGLFVIVVAVGWWFYADTLVQHGVEATGESLVGARVELESVDLRPTEGSVRLMGLQVANPDAPMSNLIEAEEITVDLMLGPLLEKKIVVENLVVSGVRFNTPRETSGELENPDPQAGQLWREVNAWSDQIEIPSLSFETLSGAVRTEAISSDSLRTVQYMTETVGRVDSMRTNWESRLTSLDPSPQLDSVRAVLQRLETFRPTPLNALQVPGLIRDGRDALSGVSGLQLDIVALDDAVREGLSSVRVGPDVVAELRSQDLAYARGLLNIPSIEAPSISPALFGGTALGWLRPILFWAQSAERFLPPGLDPRNRPGAQRTRAEGTTVEFPGRASYPKFLVQQGELGMEIAGTGPAAGAYTAQFQNLTSAPALLGQAMALTLGREDGAQGPSGLSLSAVLDHTTDILRDTVEMSLSGVGLPEIDLGAFGGLLDLGEGETTFALRRVGDQIDARLSWVSTDLAWTRTGAGAQTSTGAQIGSAEWTRDIVWSALTGVERVELGMGLEGSIDNPSISITSNVGEAVASSLRRELGQQIADAEARIQQEVDSRIEPLVRDARGRVDAVRSDVADLVAARRLEVDELRTRLEERMGALTPGLPGGQ
jgi:uncharacterized protein (TIGR03545 family)